MTREPRRGKMARTTRPSAGAADATKPKGPLSSNKLAPQPIDVPRNMLDPRWNDIVGEMTLRTRVAVMEAYIAAPERPGSTVRPRTGRKGSSDAGTSKQGWEKETVTTTTEGHWKVDFGVVEWGSKTTVTETWGGSRGGGGGSSIWDGGTGTKLKQN
jgi:hypothetical protein